MLFTGLIVNTDNYSVLFETIVLMCDSPKSYIGIGLVKKNDALKVHKIENLFGSDFEFCVISLLVMLKYKGFVKNIIWSGHYWGRYNYSIPLTLVWD